MKISLIAPVKNESARLNQGIQDLKAFVKKFPLQVELILVIDPSQDQSELVAKKIATESTQTPEFLIKVIENRKRMGRARSVQKGLSEASGEILIVTSFGWSVPLAEIFNALQELVTNPQTQVVFGNRNTSRKKRTAHLSSWAWGLEKMLMEKMRHKQNELHDPLTPFIAFRKSIYDKIRSDWNPKGWFYTPSFALTLQRHQVPVVEIPILSQDSKPSQIPVSREWARSFWF